MHAVQLSTSSLIVSMQTHPTHLSAVALSSPNPLSKNISIKVLLTALQKVSAGSFRGTASGEADSRFSSEADELSSGVRDEGACPGHSPYPTNACNRQHMNR